MDKREDKIGKSLGLEPINNMKKQIELAIDDMNSHDVDYAKQNIKDLIHLGKESLEELIDVAKMSQHPRAYEVASAFIKTLVDANKELADISMKNGKNNPTNDNRQVHNNYTFIGSTSDLLSMMKNAKEGNIDE